MTALAVELPDGHIRVGNISFNPAKILGKGCEGTFVYQVIVNRYLKGFSLAGDLG